MTKTKLLYTLARGPLNVEALGFSLPAKPIGKFGTGWTYVPTCIYSVNKQVSAMT